MLGFDSLESSHVLEAIPIGAFMSLTRTGNGTLALLFKHCLGGHSKLLITSNNINKSNRYPYLKLPCPTNAYRLYDKRTHYVCILKNLSWMLYVIVDFLGLKLGLQVWFESV